MHNNPEREQATGVLIPRSSPAWDALDEIADADQAAELWTRAANHAKQRGEELTARQAWDRADAARNRFLDSAERLAAFWREAREHAERIRR